MKEVKIGMVGIGGLGSLHLADLQYKIPGARVIAVCARREETVKEIQDRFDVAYGYTDYDDYDNAMSLIRFKNGAAAMIHVGRMHNCAHVSTEIIGTKGTIRVNNTPRINRLELFMNAEEGYDKIPLEVTYQDRFREAFLLEKQTFIDCINGLAEVPSTVYDGAKSLQLVELMHRSCVEQQAVRA